MRFNRIRACAIGAAVAVAGAFAAMPGAASATQICGSNASINGIGASFQTVAQLQWITDFRSSAAGCTTYTGTIAYFPNGSGAGRAAVGATAIADQRLTDGRGNALTIADVTFGGADEAPTTSEIANATSADTSVTYDDTDLHTIPVAQSAISVAVRLPNGCSVTANSTSRRALATTIEAAFRGATSVDTWGELLPTITGTGTVGSSNGVSCASIAFRRVVRFDSSGTTFQFKRYLFQANSGTVIAPSTTWATSANTAWPGTTVNAGSNGVGPQLRTLNAQTEFGGVAYADLASARTANFGWDSTLGNADPSFWIYAGRFDDPATRLVDESRNVASPANDNSQTGTLGAACRNVSYANVPANTTSSWFTVNGVPTSTDYPICALTYALALRDLAKVNAGINNDPAQDTSPFTRNQHIVTESYLDYVVDASGGQALLANIDYSPLPSAIRTIAQAGVDALEYTG